MSTLSRAILRMTRALTVPAAAEDGQDMVEYALLAALVSIGAIAVIVLLGPYLQNVFGDVINAFSAA